MREAVVGKHGGNGRKEADGGGDQRLGDAGSDGSQCRLADIGERAEGVHDAPDGAEQADVGDTEPTEARKARCDSSAPSISRW